MNKMHQSIESVQLIQSDMKLVIGIVLLCFSAHCNCKSLDNSMRIVGGSFASKNQFPYQIALLRNGFLSCGGSIFNEKWIITAGKL